MAQVFTASDKLKAFLAKHGNGKEDGLASGIGLNDLFVFSDHLDPAGMHVLPGRSLKSENCEVGVLARRNGGGNRT
ncbi:MAG TPA: hypothetical protein DCS05_00160 [Nitrospiraceae bacterium]|nr:hypothetical protein [Nitrospiraceae bacterium]